MCTVWYVVGVCVGATDHICPSWIGAQITAPLCSCVLVSRYMVCNATSPPLLPFIHFLAFICSFCTYPLPPLLYPPPHTHTLTLSIPPLLPIPSLLLPLSPSWLVGQGLPNLSGYILSFLDAKSLSQAELVCKKWYTAISDGQLWKKLIQRQVRVDPLWRGLAERRGWWGVWWKVECGEVGGSLVPSPTRAKWLPCEAWFWGLMYTCTVECQLSKRQSS